MEYFKASEVRGGEATVRSSEGIVSAAKCIT